ncbi:unnamed protein product [Notodromas monacha]|uniref:Neutral ceramidase n=1 Tax=Notodromas monacha TaxID=399045 RepID=A0A7R9BPP5_9CRUS|nr:unnamed protein product [Notodromas monacha]CAG0918302.1 unnamed protein product [Notodromas monacha]
MHSPVVVILMVLLVATSAFSGYVSPRNWQRQAEDEFLVGVGIADVTGPCTEVGMMGYASASQVSTGIHFRQWARSFIICSGADECVVFVSSDIGMMSAATTSLVLDKLAIKFPGLYGRHNVLLSGTHTHSGPAGYLQYFLFQITNLGYIADSTDAIVEGIVESIEAAHANLQPGHIWYGETQVNDANINRSPMAYLNNPVEEQNRYEFDVDKTMWLLRFDDAQGNPLGVLNWFAVHPTSMNNTNTLVSGDNKGVASMLFEQALNPESLPGQGKFVAAFAASNLGDVSPNIQGPKCQDTGLPCDQLTSTCGGFVQLCVASGPGRDMEESTSIIGNRQFEAAYELFNNRSLLVPIIGSVKTKHQYINMSSYEFQELSSNGEMETYTFPYKWQPDVVDTSVVLIGSLAILGVPGELTTMSGRRMRDTVAKVMNEHGIVDPKPIIAGLTNVYSDYVTTFEEYQIQRYEGASTIYGPNTLGAYLDQYKFLVNATLQGLELDAGPLPPNLLDDQISFVFDPQYDGALFDNYGDCLRNPYPSYRGGETVDVIFRAGNPRNNVRRGGTYLTVEHRQNDDTWKVIGTDANWETKFSWERTNSLTGESEARIQWTIPVNTEGVFRIRHFGDHKQIITGTISPYSGICGPFEVHATG